MTIKILLTYHDPHPIIASEILVPIQTGCVQAPELFDGMLRDDDGPNISDKNDRYCELSAQYWAWKNYDKLGNPDYIGFMHYRRHFMFDGYQGDENLVWLPHGNVYLFPMINKSYLQHIDDKNILNSLDGADCIVLKPYDVKHINSDDIRTQYAKLAEQKAENFDIFIQTSKRLYPDYIPEIELIEKGSVQYLCNMFVMKKELFEEYNKFCFSILQAVDEQIDHTDMSVAAARFLGYMGEFLLSIFVFHLYKRGDVRIKELNGSYICPSKTFKHPLFTYWWYKILHYVTWGKKRKRCKRKYKQAKYQLM